MPATWLPSAIGQGRADIRGGEGKDLVDGICVVIDAILEGCVDGGCRARPGLGIPLGTRELAGDRERNRDRFATETTG